VDQQVPGKFDMGYEAYRELVFDRQKQMGVATGRAELSPVNPYASEKSADGQKGWSELDVVRPWDSLNDGEKRLFARMAEVYAGFLSHADHQIGRLLDYLEESGQLDNTIIVLVSDNGASGEGGPNGSVNENKMFNGIPDTVEANLPYLEDLGSPATYNHYPTGWACAFNTPFKLWKRYSNWEGGTADPMIVSWSARVTASGLRRQYVHASDIVPTLYSLLGIEPPEVVKGYTQYPLEGISFEATLNDENATTDKQTQFYSMGGTRAIWHQGWKAAAVSPAAPDMWAHYATQRWELFSTEEDPSECHDLADREPEKLQELIELWWAQAGQYGALPLENRGAVEILTTERPQLTKPRSRYVYYPATAEVPESVAPNIRNRSYTVAVEVTIENEDAHGVLFAHGARFGGHALYVKDGKLKYCYNFVGDTEQVVESAEPVPAGHVVLSASFERDGDSMPAEGSLTLHAGEREVGRGRIKTQPGKFSIAGRRAQRRQGRRRAGHRRLPGRGTLVLHRRHDSPRGSRRQRTAVCRPRRRGADGFHAGLNRNGIPGRLVACLEPGRLQLAPGEVGVRVVAGRLAGGFGSGRFGVFLDAAPEPEQGHHPCHGHDQGHRVQNGLGGVGEVDADERRDRGDVAVAALQLGDLRRLRRCRRMR
jgi:arylsulfatase A-like enzyme